MGSRSSSDDLGGWLAANGLEDDTRPGAIANVALVRSPLVEAAREGRAWSYSELLARLGHRFTRPRMRALCRTLDAIDAARATAEPALAVLVVREGDGLPGQGWWIGRVDAPVSTGADARAYVSELQQAAFHFWKNAADQLP